MTLIEIPDRLAKLPVLRRMAVSFGKKIKTMNGKQSDSQIMMKIVQEFTDLSRKEIDDWRQSLLVATDINNPKWQPLQDLYDYLEPDAQLGTSKDIRVAVTLGKRFYIRSKKTGQDIPEKTAFFNTSWFFNFAWEFLDTIFKGYTVAQLVNPVTMQFDFIPRRNIIPQKNMFMFSVWGDEGISLDDPAIVDSMIVVKYKHKFGILNDIVPNLIWKKNSRAAWSEFSQKFGIPMVSATSTKRDPTDLARIETMLKNLGEAATAVLPEGTTVTIHDGVTKGDPFNVYSKQIELDDQQITKRLLGGTMIIDGGSSRSQSEVHERTLKDVISFFDKKVLGFTVNDYLLPMMMRNGYPFTPDDEFVFDDSQEMEIKDHWDIVFQALGKYEIDMDWVAKTFNLPLIKEKNTDTNFNKPFTALAAALKGKGVMLPTYNISPGLPAANFITDLLSELSDILINEIWKGEDSLVTEVLKSIKAYKLFQEGLFDNWSGRAEITYDSPDNLCLSMMEYNLFEFSRLKERSNIFALNELLIDKETNKIRPFTQFRNLALKYLKNPDLDHLYTEYKFAVAASQNAAAYLKFKSEEDTVTSFVQWQTMEDSKVRYKHSLMDKLIFSLKDPDGLSIWPPKEWGCRCEMTQYLGKPEKITSNKEGLEILGVAPGSKWDVNRGAVKQVFTANEMYLKDNNFIAGDMKQMTYDKYKLSRFDEIKENYPALSLDKSITENNVADLFKGDEKNNMPFSDYLDRKYALTKKNFDAHTTGKYLNEEESRHQLFPFVADVLAKPDEVYLIKYSTNTYQTNYVKFYKNEAFVVNTGIGKTPEIRSWYLMKKELKVRTGYLIYSK